ncbi:hypothetical protein BCR36DRAFT_20642 [Piromyces finnis]|uniref:Uncharacterized protein n=1 Tax=Piromyces finnis TaxID=1754191 RepID=A0A1Y1VDT9_9FUNG|nr:hypothetical protein BCR36DRAFT_20642 [Piromyces finnis]|eukprot:ORX53776.1 hypothetical protein BCR36DRAFT_20642 [Piromyces finnis]
MHECFQKDLNDELIDDKLASIETLFESSEKTISNYINELNECFKSQEISYENKEKAAKYLIRFVPKNIQYNNDQRTFFSIYNIFIKSKIIPIEIEIDGYGNEEL